MNPYQPPSAPAKAESSDAPDRPSVSTLVWTIVGVACAAVFARVFFDIVNPGFLGKYAPVLIGLAIGITAERGPRFHLDQRWSLIAVGVTSAALVVSFVVGAVVAPNALFAPFAYLAALVIAGVRVARAERRAHELDSLDMRDRDQRAHFAEMERREREQPFRKQAPVSTTLRLACAVCGELTDESELQSVDGRRVCATCA